MWQTSVPVAASGTATLTVNDATSYQTFDGFGGAFNEKGWNSLQSLSANDRQLALTLLFDAANGAHFGYGRIPIGANDYAMTLYTDDEVPSGMQDYNLAKFNTTEDEKYLVPYVQAALAVNPGIQFWASPWTPPTWMKSGTPGTMSNGTCTLSGGAYSTSPFDGETMKSDSMTLGTYANYFVQWIEAYETKYHVTISALMPQNEPNYPENYPSAQWDATTYDTFVKTLGQTLANSSDPVVKNVKLFLGTMSNDNSGADPAIISKVMGDSAAFSFIHGFALQWGMQGTPDSNGNPTMPGALSTNISAVASSTLPKWQTEHMCGNYPWQTSSYNATKAPNDYAYGVESWGHIRDWLKAGVSTYSAWNMVTDPLGLGNDTCRDWKQDSLLVVNGSTLVVTPAYYVFRHFSQYIDAGATRVGTSGSSALDALAFKNADGSHVVVMYNSGSSAAATVVSVGGATYSFSVPANGFATLRV